MATIWPDRINKIQDELKKEPLCAAKHMTSLFEIVDKGEDAFQALSEEAQAFVDTQPYLYDTLKRQYLEFKNIYQKEFLDAKTQQRELPYYSFLYVCGCQGSCHTCKQRKLIDNSEPVQREPDTIALQVPYAERTLNRFLQAYLIAAIEYLWSVMMQPSRFKIIASTDYGLMLDVNFLCRVCKHNLKWVAFRKEVGKFVFHFQDGRELSSWDFD